MSGFREEGKCESALSANRRFGIEKGNKDLVNHRFGKLVVIKFDSFNEKQRGSTQWLCRCDCGKEKVVGRQHLLRGNTKSCGCIKAEYEESHDKGMYKTPEYRTWIRIKTRCENENTPYYFNYGGRGIKVCEKWSKSFEAFYADMGNRPSKDYSIDRKDNNGDYEPDNCKWSTRFEQQRNIRLQKNNSTGVNGVQWDKKINKYVARMTFCDKNLHIGCFELIEDAARARREAEIKYWGK